MGIAVLSMVVCSRLVEPFSGIASFDDIFSSAVLFDHGAASIIKIVVCTAVAMIYWFGILAPILRVFLLLSFSNGRSVWFPLVR